MKKVLNTLLALVGFLLLTFVVLYETNFMLNWVAIPANYTTIIAYVLTYGALVLVSLWTLVTFWGKGFFRILFLILTIIVVAGGVIVFVFPQVITNLIA